MPRKNATIPLKSEIRPLTSDDISSDITPDFSPLSDSYEKRSASRLENWRSSPYAVGLVPETWLEETKSFKSNTRGDSEENDKNMNCCENATSDTVDPTCGCLLISGLVCGRLGFKRLGNMVLIKQNLLEYDNPPELNDLDDSMQNTEIVFIIGPYWPMLFFVTYPLILGVSFLTGIRVVFAPSSFDIYIAVIWTALTFGLCLALFCVSCRDPGILRKHTSPPDGDTMSSWRWDDRVHSYIPRRASYDTDCALVIDEFDHTCPWTGTAIGRKNMPAFQAFIALIFICLFMDIILLTSSSII